MTNTKKQVNKKRLAVLLMSCLMLLSVLFGAMPITAKANSESSNWDFHGIDISNRESIDLYFLEISLADIGIKDGKKGRYVLLNGNDNAVMLALNTALNWDLNTYFNFHKSFWNDMQYEMIYRFVFPNIKVKDTDGEMKSIYLDAKADVILPAAWKIAEKDRVYILAETLNISLSNNYYKALKKLETDTGKPLDFTYYLAIGFTRKMYPTYIKENKKSVYTFTDSNAKIYTTATDPNVMNPDSDDFDPNAGNNGDNTITTKPPVIVDIPKEKFNFNKITSAVANFFNTTVDVIYTVAILITSIGIIVSIFKKK